MSTRPVPTNLDAWPGVTDLLISQKFLLHVLWSSPPGLVSVCGVGRPGIIERLCGASRLDEPVVAEALRELDRRGLVVFDEETREVALRRWTRFHKFAGRWASAAEKAYEEIESARVKSILVQQEGLKAIFPNKSNNSAPTQPQPQPQPQRNSLACSTPEGAQPDACGDVGAVQEKNEEGGETATTRPQSTERGFAPPPVGVRKALKTIHGVECWTPEDLSTVGALVTQHGAALVEEAAKEIVGMGSKPYPSVVQKRLKGINNNGKNNLDFTVACPSAGDEFSAAVARSQARRVAGA